MASITVDRWRSFSGLTLAVPPEARFVCLVGENGTGKSSLLELVTWAAHRIGIAAQIPLRRPIAAPEPGTEMSVEVVIDTEREELREVLASISPSVRESWNRTLVFQARSWAGETPADIPDDASANTVPGVGGAYDIVRAGGVSSGFSPHAGNLLVGALRQLPELLHLYIDADRVFPSVDVRDEEILALARQDPTLPSWLKEQASQGTQNLYLEWMRSMLGRQQRLQSAYFQEALEAAEHGGEIRPPTDPLAAYRTGLARVLPHLRFVRLDQDMRRLIFDSAGNELAYEALSGGERELAFLLGQIDRFGVRDGLFLLDEPELHLNAELLRGWLDYLRSTVRDGQAWVATHSLEAAEIAGPVATLVLERDDDRIVRRAAPLANRPALGTLAAAVGTPAFSVGRSRFVLIEGKRERRERERFATLLDASVADRYIEADGCEEVLAKVAALRSLASSEEQLRVGGVIDRDFRTDAQREELKSTHGVHVMSVHEVENLFLQPVLLRRLLADTGRDADDVLRILQEAADPDAGRWAFEKTKSEEDWEEAGRPPRAVAGRIAWSEASTDVDEAARQIASAIPGIEGAEVARRRLAVRHRFEEYEVLRTDEDGLSQWCFGKEVLPRVSAELAFKDSSAIESRAAVLWRLDEVPRPPAAAEIRAYLDGIPVLKN